VFSLLGLFFNLSHTAIYPLLRFISWNLITRCLAVTDGGRNVDECDRLSQSSWVLGVLHSTLLTHLLVIQYQCSCSCLPTLTGLPINQRAYWTTSGWSSDLRC